MVRTLALALSFLALTAGEAQVSAPTGNTSRLLAHDHAASETTLVLVKAAQPWLRTSAASDLVLATEKLGSITGRGTTDYQVVVVPGFTLSELEQVEEQGAVGLLVPGAGPETSATLARAALERGAVRNSLRDGLPRGRVLVEAETGELGSASGPAIYVGLPAGGRQPNDRRYPILVVGRGYEGLLTSESTRIPGLVSVADVAPTALGREDALGFEPEDRAAAQLLELDRRIDENGRARFPAELLACALVALFALVFPAAAVPALAAVLLANLALGIAGVSDVWVVLLVIGLAAALGGPLLAFAWSTPLLLGLGLAATLAAYAIALGLDGSVVALSPLGPTQNSRFFGLSNLLETMMLLPALGGAWLLASRLGWAGFGAVALLTFVTVAGNRFGADGGGAVVLAVGFAVLGVLIARVRRRALVLALAGAVALALGLLGVDAATGSESHVSKALRGGPTGLAEDLGERVSLSVARATDDWYVALLLAVLSVALALLVARTALRRGATRDTAVPLGLAAALAASLVVNDSPNDVLLVGVASYLAADRGMLPARWLPGPSPWRLRSPLSASSPSPAAAARRTSRLRPKP